MKNTQNPDFDGFSAIFYHEKTSQLIIEVWHKRVFVDTIIGKAAIDIDVERDDDDVQKLELRGKGADFDGTTGFIQIIIQTSRDLNKF